METPAKRYGNEAKTHEIGATSGEEHHEVLARALGRERGLAAATGVDANDPVVVGERARALEGTSVNQEINEKKIERHGDVGGER